VTGAATIAAMFLAIDWLPPLRPAPQLLILLHGAGAGGTAMLPLAVALRVAFPQAAIVAPDAPDGQWFSVAGIDEQNRVDRVQAVLPALHDWIVATQDRLAVGPQATAIAGFSQGAILALELVRRHDGLAGRVLAFGGRYASLPDAAPQCTTIHLLHGAGDEVIPADHARAALGHLGVLHGDATLDIAQGVGHVLHPALVDAAVQRLQTHIPQRTWRAALGAAATLPDAD
jgi:phospholipase/carboxylesterase